MEKKYENFLWKWEQIFFFFFKYTELSQYTEIKLSTVGQIVCYIVKFLKHAQVSKFNVLNGKLVYSAWKPCRKGK